MDFVAVLDQVVDLLRQRGRVTYRTLKRQFQLDDEALEDLTVELIKGQRLAVDEDGSWSGLVEQPHRPHRRHPRQNAVNSLCCFAIWWIRPPSPASSTRKSCVRWCGPIKTPAPR